MGIQKLTSFVNEYFAGWDNRKIRGRLVVDGNSVLHVLHTMEWSNGGQYAEFRKAVRRFYSRLRMSGIHPIVVFDGVDEEQKTDTLLRRKQEWVSYIHKQITSNTSRCIKCRGRILPMLCSEVYRMTLHDMGIQFYVADGEADLTIARIANHYSCPVLSQDSDFFVFRLVGGYIPIDHFYWESFVVTANVYHRDRFAAQLKFQESNLFCAIPAIVGNDFLAPCTSSFIRSILDSVPNRGSFKNLIRPLCLYLSQFCSLESYISSVSGDGKQEARCREAVEWYSIPDNLSCEELVESTVLKHQDGSNFPRWLIRLFHQGHVPTAPIGAAVIGKIIFRMVPDNFQKKSSIVAGQIVRQHMYALLECKEVVEVFRHGLVLSSVKVPSKWLSGEFDTVTVSSIESLSHRDRRRLFFKIMQCDEKVFIKLTGKYHDWQFVAATASLWARTTGTPMPIVKALLLCFMVCSGLNDSKLDSVRRTCRSRVPVGFRQSQKWLNVMHSFMEWQVIHHTAWTLNALLMEPMTVFSPAFLYDGEIAMCLGSTEDIGRLVFAFDIDMTLYSHLEEVVLSVHIPTPPCETEDITPVPVSEPVSVPKAVSTVNVQTHCGSQEEDMIKCVKKVPVVADNAVLEENVADRECINMTPQIQCGRMKAEKMPLHKTERANVEILNPTNEQQIGVLVGQSQDVQLDINSPRMEKIQMSTPQNTRAEAQMSTPWNTRAEAQMSTPRNTRAQVKEGKHSRQKEAVAPTTFQRQTSEQQGRVERTPKVPTVQEKTSKVPRPAAEGTSTDSTSQVTTTLSASVATQKGRSTAPKNAQKQNSAERKDDKTPKLPQYVNSPREETSQAGMPRSRPSAHRSLPQGTGALQRVDTPCEENLMPTFKGVTSTAQEVLKQKPKTSQLSQASKGSQEATSRKQVPELRSQELKTSAWKHRQRRHHRAKQSAQKDVAKKPAT